jgi:hypothetical protein
VNRNHSTALAGGHRTSLFSPTKAGKA